jgi:hypothetical protein
MSLNEIIIDHIDDKYAYGNFKNKVFKFSIK